jgi:hypothetical protein
VRTSYIYVALLLVSVVTLILSGVANWSFPQGEYYPTGRYEQLSNEWMERPEYNQMPSPESNPIWVRVFQNNTVLLALASFVGIFVSVSKLKHWTVG